LIKTRDLDDLSARLHGRRSRLAEGGRLRGLCALESPESLSAAIITGPRLSGSRQVQLRVSGDFYSEVMELASALGNARGRFVEWLAARLEVENLKVVIRGLGAGLSPEKYFPDMIPLPGRRRNDGPAAETPEQFVKSMAPGILKRALEEAYLVYPDRSRSFFREAALDRAYLGEMLVRLNALNKADREYSAPLVRHEIAVFNLMLAARGRFFYGLEKKELLGLFAAGSRLDRRKFLAMLSASGVGALRALAAGSAVNAGPEEPEAGALEVLAWDRYAKLAMRAFRGAPVGFGAVAGYLALRRLETANLITVAEGLRLGVNSGELAGRMLPRLGRPDV